MSIVDTEAHDDAAARHRWRRWAALAGGAALVLVAVAGLYAWSQYRTLTSAKYQVVSYSVPTAPRLVAATGETVYRIDPTHSQVSYAVDEKLFGHSRHRAQGITNGIAGDLALNRAEPDASRIGPIVVNVEQLHSDNNLRDARMRASNLDSHDYPLATLSVTKVRGLPASITEGREYPFTLDGTLTVKTTTAPVSWQATGKFANGRLSATATTKVKMSTFGIGPISIAGLVSTGNDVTLTMNVSALDPSKYSIPTSIAAPPSAPRSKNSPSFRDVVMPALAANCASCHEPGQIGAGNWTLTKASDAADISDGIGSVVAAKYMPPWPASTVGVPLAHSRALDQTTLDAIVAWAKAGGPLDVPGSTPITPTASPAGPPPRHDVTMRMTEGYRGSLASPNDYRCFILDPHFTAPTYLTGYEVLPDQRFEIHHVQIFHIDASQAAEGRALSGKDGKPGMSCYGTANLRSTQPHKQRRMLGFTGQDGLVAGWVPGQDPVTFPAGTGMLFQPGDELVLQMHYHYHRPPVFDRTAVALQTAPGTKALKPIDIINPVGPVEIPCSAGVTAPLCNRDAALAEAFRLYGPAGPSIEPGLLALCGKTADQLAATFHDGVASSTCNYTVPEDGTIISVFGHEHTLGRTFRLTLDPDTPASKVLLDIPTWNFDWQMNYGLAQPLHVKAGQTVRMDCTWDRALDPNRPQKYIVFAEGTEDEMCFATYAIVPDHAG